MLIQGDAAKIPLPDKSIHCVTTSPPYYGLRKYTGKQGRGKFPKFGLEPTPDEYVRNMVAIFSEVHRVLRDDGVVWLNLGDSYAGSGKGAANYKGPISGKQKTNRGIMVGAGGLPVFKGYSAGNLMMVPHRVAIALQEWGWIVRNDVVWHKPNPMTESQAGWRFENSEKCDCFDYDYQAIGIIDESDQKGRRPGAMGSSLADPNCFKCQGSGKIGEPKLKKGSFRHTRSHEYVFMLTKKMQYWSNQEAVKEKDSGQKGAAADVIRNSEGVLVPNQQAKQHRHDRKPVLSTGGRNPRSVIKVPTASYKGAHYATFPPNLIVPLIRATCPRWACPVCGQGWSPVVEKSIEPHPNRWSKTNDAKQFKMGNDDYVDGGNLGVAHHSNVKEYRPTCEHSHTIEEAVPGIVLDPFLGSGTVAFVAKQLQRRWAGLDISYEYLDEQARYRAGWGEQKTKVDDLPLFQHDAH